MLGSGVIVSVFICVYDLCFSLVAVALICGYSPARPRDPWSFVPPVPWSSGVLCHHQITGSVEDVRSKAIR